MIAPEQQSALEELGLAAIEQPGALCPTLAPTDLEHCQALLASAQTMGWRLSPTGAQSQSAAWNAPGDFDFGVDTRALQSKLSFEPGEGVISAPASARWADVQAAVHAHGQTVSPTWPNLGAKTVGGVVAAGLSGVDRVHLGALRHHVLGMRVLLANGSVATFGGPLVKNVTGFALQRLFTGSRGRLGIILEVFLRTYPAPPQRTAWNVAASEPDALVRIVQRLRAACLPNSALRWTQTQPDHAKLQIDCQGTEGALSDAHAALHLLVDAAECDPVRSEATFASAWDCTNAATAIPTAEPATDRTQSTLILQSQPSHFSAVHAALTKVAREGLEWTAMPDIGEWRVRWSSIDSAWISSLDTALERVPCRWHWLGANAPKPVRGGPAAGASPASPLRQAQAALIHQFDPHGRFQPRLQATQAQ